MYEALPVEAIESEFNMDNEDDKFGYEPELKRIWETLGYKIDTNPSFKKYTYVDCLSILKIKDLEAIVKALFNDKCRESLECQWCGKKMKSKSGLALHEKKCEEDYTYD